MVKGGALDHAQEWPRATEVYDRAKECPTQDEVERIRL
jgi:hypothetical protein